MDICFYKMHGLGNDFVVIDMTQQEYPLSSEIIQTIAHRKTGVGCDQVLTLKKSTQAHCDFLYQIYNADGSEVGQCGNGARCLGLLIQMARLSDQPRWQLHTRTTELNVTPVTDGQFKVDLPAATFSPDSIPMQWPTNNHLQLDGTRIPFMAANVGNPHVILKKQDLATSDLNAIGYHLNRSPLFPEGVNVNFIDMISPNEVHLEVYERGAGLTQACGSGACATFACLHRQHPDLYTVAITQPGGTLMLQNNPVNNGIQMTGSASFVFKGTISI